MNPESPNICPECGRAVPADSPHRLCPACLLAQALASRTICGEGKKSGATPPPAPEEIADRFPQFEITECLGRGGMGVVYKARQKSLDRWVALKILAPERVGQEKFAERFAREAQTLARLNHPNIVGVFDYGETGGLYYFVMEFVDGVNLRDLLREGRLEAKQALAIVPPICDALQYAHEKGIVHRDIKPENLLLDRDGRVKIADFGIAALVGADGEAAGTPPYMAPEQTDACREVDHRADIYALGVVLYEMLTGERPGTEAIAPSRKVQIDVRLDEIVLRALEKNPERRYAQASVFKTQVETLSASPEAVDAPAGVSPERIRREKVMIGGASAIFVAAFFLATKLALDFPRQAAGPFILMALSVVGLIVCGVRFSGFWPLPSLLFPQSNFSSRNLGRTSDARPSRAAVSHITATLCLTALLMGLFINSPQSNMVIVIGITGFIAALSDLKRRGAWPFSSGVVNKAVREILSPSTASFLAKCALVLFLAALILPLILASFAPERFALLVGAVCGIASFVLGLVTWKSLPGRIAAIGVPIVAIALTGLVLVRKEQVRRIAASASGPVVERTLDNQGEIDFETGKIVAQYPEIVTREDDIPKALLNALEWMRREGLDATYDTGGWFSTKGLKCVDMKTTPLSDGAWNRIAPEQLSAALGGAKAEEWGTLDCRGKFPKTYAFQTRGGAVGILQLIGTTEDPQSVRLRYKLTQSTSRK